MLPANKAANGYGTRHPSAHHSVHSFAPNHGKVHVQMTGKEAMEEESKQGIKNPIELHRWWW